MSRVTALAWVISITLATVVGAESASQSWRAAWNVTRAYLEGPDYLRPPRHYKTLKMMLAEAGLAPPPRVSASRALTGTREILVILVRLTDATPNPSHTTAYYHDRFFATSPPSVSDYYDEVSYGNFTFVPGAVLGWYPSGYDRYQWAYVDPSPVVVEAIQDVDADFDFAPYDTDSDGTVTNEELSIFIIVSGTTGGASHWWTNTPVVTADGVTVEGEFSGAHEDRHIGSYAHELGHDLGLPDLYDTDTGLTGDSEGIGRYGLMGGGSWTFSHLSAWSKIQLGWITPTILFTSAYHDVRDAETNAEAYVLVDYSHSTEEYFLVENRYPRNS
jgi:immune inhibitor A